MTLPSLPVNLLTRWGPSAAMVLALGWLATVLAQWVWVLLPAPEPAPPTLTQSPPPAPVAAPAPRLAETINAAALWGRAPLAKAETARDTRLPLRLRGVLAGSGLALISTSGQMEKVYRIGESLPGGAILREVHKDHVLIERAGVLERLAIPRQGLGPASQAGGQAATTPTAGRPAGETLGRMLQRSPAELMRDFRIEPVIENGAIRGYRLHALRDPSLLQRAGLRPDDVIINVNGQPLTKVTNLPGLLQSVRNAAAIEVIVLRNGVEMPLQIDMDG